MLKDLLFAHQRNPPRESVSLCEHWEAAGYVPREPTATECGWLQLEPFQPSDSCGAGIVTTRSQSVQVRHTLVTTSHIVWNRNQEATNCKHGEHASCC